MRGGCIRSLLIVKRCRKALFLFQNIDEEQFTNFRTIKQTSTRIQACEELQKFCNHKQASTRLKFMSKSSNGQILPALENLKRPFSTPSLGLLNTNLPTYYSNTVILEIEEMARLRAMAPVVQKVDNTIHQRNHYALDSAIGFPINYSADSGLSSRERYPLFEQQ